MFAEVDELTKHTVWWGAVAKSLRYDAIIWGSVVAKSSKMLLSVVTATSLPLSEIPISFPVSWA